MSSCHITQFRKSKRSRKLLKELKLHSSPDQNWLPNSNERERELVLKELHDFILTVNLRKTLFLEFENLLEIKYFFLLEINLAVLRPLSSPEIFVQNSRQLSEDFQMQPYLLHCMQQPSFSQNYKLYGPQRNKAAMW